MKVADMNLDRNHLLTSTSSLGYRALSRTWAKLEILLGLSAVGVGLFLGLGVRGHGETLWVVVAAGLALFVLGGYSTLAGHRSHLYQSQQRADRLPGVLEIHHLKDKGRPA